MLFIRTFKYSDVSEISKISNKTIYIDKLLIISNYYILFIRKINIYELKYIKNYIKSCNWWDIIKLVKKIEKKNVQ